MSRRAACVQKPRCLTARPADYAARLVNLKAPFSRKNIGSALPRPGRQTRVKLNSWRLGVSRSLG